MMKNSKYKFILLIPVLCLITSSVDPVNAAATTKGAGAEVALAVTSGITLLKDTMNQAQKMDKKAISRIEQITKEVEEAQGLKYPSANTLKKGVLETLYLTKDKTVRLRRVLEGLATDLKTSCEGLIRIYEKHSDTPHKQKLLKFSVDRFVKLARDAKETLNYASDLLADAQKEFAGTLAALHAYNGELKRVKGEIQKEIKQLEEKSGKRRKRFVCFGLCIAGAIAAVAGVGTAIGFAVKAGQDKAYYQEQLNSANHYNNIVNNLEKSIDGLIDENKKLRNYVSEEVSLIEDWKIKLQTSIRDHEDGITDMDILFAIDEIKINLKALIGACDNYLAHKLPDGIRKRGLPDGIRKRGLPDGIRKRGLPFYVDGRPAMIGFPSTAQTLIRRGLTRSSSDATAVSTTGGVVGDVIAGVSLLKDVIKSVANPNQGMDDTTSARLHDITKQLEDTRSIGDISHLKQEVLMNLYQSQDKNANIIQVFKSLTNDLKSGSEGIIRIYEKYPDNNSPQLLDYSITRFEKLARDGIETLKHASTLLTNAQEVFTTTRAASNTYNHKIKEIKDNTENEIKKVTENDSRNPQFECEGSCIAQIPTIFLQYVATAIDYDLRVGIPDESKTVTSPVTTTGLIDANEQLISANKTHNSVASLVNTISSLIDTNKQLILRNKPHNSVASIGNTISSLIDANEQLILTSNTLESIDNLQNTISGLIHAYEQLILSNKIHNNIVSLWNAIDGLIDANEQLIIYVQDALHLLDDWRTKLQATLKNRGDDMTPLNIKDGIIEIKAHLKQLIKASNN